MAYLEFNKEELVNLEYALQREILLTNRAGGYVNTTIVGCNTRKYHGLLIVPIKEFGMQKHILLSSLNETLIQHEQSFNLGINSYDDVYEPRGHKYIVDFEMNYASTITYRVGGMKFLKTIMFVRDSEEVLIKYTLEEANSPTTLRISPFLAFRNIHGLTSANTEANTRYENVDKGVSFNMYKGFPSLFLQLNKKGDWIASPDWYKGISYKEEQRRGFNYKEDLFVPGYFEIPIKKGESIILSASTSEVRASGLKLRFEKEVEKRDNMRDNYKKCLSMSADQFLIKQNEEFQVCSGYSWNYSNPRETFIALPGLTIFNNGDTKRFESVLDCVLQRYNNELIGNSEMPDAPLWLFKALQHYIDFNKENSKRIWKKYSGIVNQIIDSYINGGKAEARLHDNGLLWIQKYNTALTWMSTCVDGVPVSERYGYQVENNALWYNGLVFIAEMESMCGDKNRAKQLLALSEKTKQSFNDVFKLDNGVNCLADYVNEREVNTFVRPNQLIASSLKHTPVDDFTKLCILKRTNSELLTTRGIRTLAPKNPLYKGVYEGGQRDRDVAHYNGCAMPWLVASYIELDLLLNGKRASKRGLDMLNAFEEDINVHGIGSVAEIYDGSPSHKPHGCISSAISIAEILRGLYILDKIK